MASSSKNTFKTGDLICGVSADRYGITNEDMYCGEVKKINSSGEMYVVIREHRDDGEVGYGHWVLNSSDYFKPYTEKAPQSNSALYNLLFSGK